MFCGNCGSPLNNKELFCGNCGIRVNGIPTQKKKNPVIYIVPIAIVIVIVAVTFIFFSKTNDNSAIYGKWECNDHMIFKFDRNKTFEIYELYDKSELYVEGNYKINSKTEDDDTLKYRLTLTSDHRVVEGVSRDSYKMTNVYEISLSTNKPDEMVMISEKTYNTYYCKKNEH